MGCYCNVFFTHSVGELVALSFFLRLTIRSLCMFVCYCFCICLRFILFHIRLSRSKSMSKILRRSFCRSWRDSTHALVSLITAMLLSFRGCSVIRVRRLRLRPLALENPPLGAVEHTTAEAGYESKHIKSVWEFFNAKRYWSAVKVLKAWFCPERPILVDLVFSKVWLAGSDIVLVNSSSRRFYWLLYKPFWSL